jgi:dUTP pyrophosphatase
MTMVVEVARRAGTEDLPLPAYQSAGASGMDLLAAVDAPLTVPAGGRALVPTGLYVAVPPGYEAQVRARSGLSLKKGVCVLNGPGTVDSDYRGEVGVILANLGDEPFVVERGMRVAQMVIAPVVRVELCAVSRLDDTVRGGGGFGSSGVKG